MSQTENKIELTPDSDIDSLLREAETVVENIRKFQEEQQRKDEEEIDKHVDALYRDLLWYIINEATNSLYPSLCLHTEVQESSGNRIAESFRKKYPKVAGLYVRVEYSSYRNCYDFKLTLI